MDCKIAIELVEKLEHILEDRQEGSLFQRALNRGISRGSSISILDSISILSGVAGIVSADIYLFEPQPSDYEHGKLVGYVTTMVVIINELQQTIESNADDIGIIFQLREAVLELRNSVDLEEE